MSELLLTPGIAPIKAESLPPTWAPKQLSDFCTFIQGGRLGLTKQDHYRTSGVPAFSAAGQDGFVDVPEFRNTEAVVLSAIGANCGRCFLARGHWTTLANVQVVIPDLAEADARFLHYRVNREDYWPRSGSAQPFIKPSDIRLCWVALPPLCQQIAIGDVLNTLDTAIHETEAIIAKLKAIKQGLLHDLLTRGVDANGELRPPQAEAPDVYKESPMGWIPKQWECRQFYQLADYENGNTFDAGAWTDTGLPIIRIQNLNGSPDFNYYTGKVHERWYARPGDLLFAWAGQRGISFGARLWTGPEGVLNQHIFKVVPDEGIVFKSYLFRLLRFRQAAIEDSAHGFKDSVLHVTRGELGSVHVGVPSMTEQSLIEQRIAGLEIKQVTEEASLHKLKRMKSGLMDDLLTGRVRVTPLLEGASP